MAVSGSLPKLAAMSGKRNLLLAALRIRPDERTHRLRIVLVSGRTVDVTIEGGDLGAAVAKAIRSVERSEGRVARVDVDYAPPR